MMPHFPFVVLPTDVTTGGLRECKPFLFLAILSVSVTDDRALKRALDEEVRAAVAERTVLARRSASLETLQGLLVLLAWSQHQVQLRSAPRDFSTYLHLAIGIAVDLNLDRPVELQRSGRRMNVHETKTDVRPLATQREEQRAVIGCSFLSSCFAVISQRMCTFPWSSYLEAFAVELAQNPEYGSDASIIDLVRLQHIFEEIDRVSIGPDSLDMDGSAFQHTFRSFKTRLQEYTSQLSPQLTADHFILASQMHTVNLYLCQVGLFDKASTSHLPLSFRSEILCHGLAAAKSSFDWMAMLPLGTERSFSYSEWLQSGFNLILSCKLALMAMSEEHRHPQVQALCDALDMAGVLRNCVNRQECLQAGSQNTGFDYTGWLRWIQDWFARHYQGYVSRRAAPTTPQPPSTAPVTGMPAPTEQFATGEMYHGGNLPVTSDDMLPWTSFPDFMLAQNPLAGWMDLSLMPM
ncbi:hypothetical protein BDW62DRAFT_151173 [Aspergillus aurantiobrunneus]